MADRTVEPGRTHPECPLCAGSGAALVGRCPECDGQGAACCRECSRKLTWREADECVSGERVRWLCADCSGEADEDEPTCWCCEQPHPVAGVSDGHPLCRRCLQVAQIPVEPGQAAIPDLLTPLEATLALVADARAVGVAPAKAFALLRRAQRRTVK